MRISWLPMQPWSLSMALAGALILCGSPRTYANWMRDLPDSRNLAAISIPGTHSSCALHGGLDVQCQTMTLTEQLNAGVRFLDIRCAGTQLSIYHGKFFQKLKFREMQNECIAFLKRNPSECIVMAIQQEEDTPHGKSKDLSFAKYLGLWIYQRRSDWYLSETGRVPNLGTVRGKMVLMPKGSRISGIALDGFTVQNDSTVPTLSDIPKKWNKVKANLLAANRNPGKKFATFSSGSGGPEATPKSVAASINDSLEDFFKFEQPKHVGILIMDFPSQKLINAVIQANFPYKHLYLRLRHQGGYVAKFSVTWRENGVAKSRNLGSKIQGWSQTLTLPGNATDLRVHAQAAVFIATWRDIHNGPVTPGSYTASGTAGSRRWNRD